MQSLRRKMGRGGFCNSRTWPSWVHPVALAIAVGVSYFFAARLSLALLTKPDGVAVFWPGAGIAAGTIIALGFGARVPVAAGVIIASATASVFGDRNFAAGIIFALCNGAEPLLVAWLVRRHFGDNFRLESLRSVLGLFAAAGVGTAISGSLATVGFVLFYSSSASVLSTWLNWVASDALGIVMVAPLLIGLSSFRGQRPDGRELLKGVVTLAALAIVSAIAFTAPAHYALTVLPAGILLPILVSAHCRPVFAAAAALIVSIAVVWSTTFGIGDLGEIADLHDRAYAARATLLAISTCTLVLAALFAERRQKEAALEDANDRLELALDSAELGVWSFDAKTRRFVTDDRNTSIHGFPPEAMPETLPDARALMHPDDVPRFDAAFSVSKRQGGSCRVEYRLSPAAAGTGQERWVSVEGTVVRGAGGRPIRWLGVTRDITERKKAEQVAQRLVSIVESSDDAIVSKDLNGIIESWNKGAERLFGYSSREIVGRPVSILIPPHREREERAILARIWRGEHIDHFETVRRRKDGTLVDVSLTVSPLRDATGAVIGASKIARDISARKKAEEHQHALNAELDHRVKNVLATVSAIINQTQEASRSHADFVAGLDHRIRSLASTHELLSEMRWHGVSLAEIVRREFAPFARGNTVIDGPSVTLKADAAQPVAMVLHELTTNAAKYGAFSNQGGYVLLRWRWLHNGSGDRLAIVWQETGGPSVAPPSRCGYGTCIVRELIPFELGGTVDLDFARDGLRCRLEIPAAWVNKDTAAYGELQYLNSDSAVPVD